MTPADLKALLERATKGPFKTDLDMFEEGVIEATVFEDGTEFLATADSGQRSDGSPGPWKVAREGKTFATTSLIVAAVNALPHLVALWEAAERLEDVLPRFMPMSSACEAANEMADALTALKAMS